MMRRNGCPLGLLESDATAGKWPTFLGRARSVLDRPCVVVTHSRPFRRVQRQNESRFASAPWVLPFSLGRGQRAQGVGGCIKQRKGAKKE